MTPGRRLAVTGLLAAVVATVAVSVVLARPQSASDFEVPPNALLPDLDPVAPGQLQARVIDIDGKRHVQLSFLSSAENVGAGALWIRGARAGTGSETMSAEQVIRLKDGSTVTKPDVGDMRYIVDPTHQHWHLEPFMIYELRRSKGFKLLRPDEKTGFCLGDRYPIADPSRLPSPPGPPEFVSSCGLGDTTLLAVEEGISPGYGDPYRPWLDGQWIDVTGVKAGRYVLVHRVNVGRFLAESNYANNASSVLISLTWPTGKQGLPQIKLLKTCPNVANCKIKGKGRR